MKFLNDFQGQLPGIARGGLKASFRGFFRTQLLRYFFEKSSELIFKIFIYYGIDEFYCIKIIKTYTNWMADSLVFQTVDLSESLTAILDG